MTLNVRLLNVLELKTEPKGSVLLFLLKWGSKVIYFKISFINMLITFALLTDQNDFCIIDFVI